MPFLKLGFSADAVSNYFLIRADNEGRPITPMKLQKLMYFAHGWHLALDTSGDSLIAEDAQAWDYGPVFPHTYYEFKDFGNRPIDRLAVKATFNNGKLRLISPTIENEQDQVKDLD